MPNVDDSQLPTDQLPANACAWAEVALANVVREFPYVQPVLFARPDDQIRRPRETHPAFFGSYDWHSCVEMHWLLVRLLRTVPEQIDASRVRSQLDAHLCPEAISVEAAHLPRWERPYGYGWALMLAAEIEALDDSDAERWAEAMRPLSGKVVEDLAGWLAQMSFPVRSGLHGNSAFGLSLALRYASTYEPSLAEVIEAAARRWFASDTEYPAHYEPSGTDFLSPALTEAELMAGVLPAREWVAWFDRYLPGVARGEPATLFTPVEVSDSSDGQLAHLHGLNLSRAWCFRRLAGSLPAGDPRIEVMLASAERHQEASLGEAVGSDYMVEHWLAAYAVLLTTQGR